MIWARNEDLLRYITVMQAPMWMIDSYYELRGVETEWGPESAPPESSSELPSFLQDAPVS